MAGAGKGAKEKKTCAKKTSQSWPGPAWPPYFGSKGDLPPEPKRGEAPRRCNRSRHHGRQECPKQKVLAINLRRPHTYNERTSRMSRLSQRRRPPYCRGEQHFHIPRPRLSRQVQEQSSGTNQN